MSVTLTIESPQLQTTSNPVVMVTSLGVVVHCHRVATYQIDTKTGRSILVLGSVIFEDHNGSPITNIVGPHITNNAPSITNTRMWFWSAIGGPIYLDNGIFYTHTGDTYTGDVTNYQPSTEINSSPTETANITIAKCWIKFPSSVYISLYLPATKVTKISFVNNSPVVVNFVMVAGDIYETPVDVVVVDDLPSPVYEQISQTITEQAPSSAPTDVAISGFACSWIISYPTIDNPQLGEVLIGDASYDVSGSETLNAESPFGTVVPPYIMCRNAVVKAIYRIRTSPVLISEPPVMPIETV